VAGGETNSRPVANRSQPWGAPRTTAGLGETNPMGSWEGRATFRPSVTPWWASPNEPDPTLVRPGSETATGPGRAALPERTQYLPAPSPGRIQQGSRVVGGETNPRPPTKRTQGRGRQEGVAPNEPKGNLGALERGVGRPRRGDGFPERTQHQFGRPWFRKRHRPRRGGLPRTNPAAVRALTRTNPRGSS
jgi:hypothetical protein